MHMSRELPKSTHGAAGRVLSSGESGEEIPCDAWILEVQATFASTIIMVQSRTKILTKIRRVKWNTW